MTQTTPPPHIRDVVIVGARVAATERRDASLDVTVLEARDRVAAEIVGR